jgi:SAM-dependent methyltransferase
MDIISEMVSLYYFKALSDLTRIRIYNVLLSYELSVNELVALMDMGQSGISRHVKILADSGLLSCRRNGVWAFYSANRSEPVASFSASVQQLFEDEERLRIDLKRAGQVVRERHEKTRQFFNDIAHKWDALKQEILGPFDLNAAIMADAGIVETAADLGCGTGELMSFLTGYAGRVIGVDSSPGMLDETRKRFLQGGGRAELRLGELEHLPMKDGEVDLAVISMALHHLSHPLEAIDEAYRILSRKGTLIIAEFDRHDNENLRQQYGDRWLGFSNEEVRSWVLDSGFSQCRVKPYRLQQSLTLNIFTCTK